MLQHGRQLLLQMSSGLLHLGGRVQVSRCSRRILFCQCFERAMCQPELTAVDQSAVLLRQWTLLVRRLHARNVPHPRIRGVSETVPSAPRWDRWGHSRPGSRRPRLDLPSSVPPDSSGSRTDSSGTWSDAGGSWTDSDWTWTDPHPSPNPRTSPRYPAISTVPNTTSAATTRSCDNPNAEHHQYVPGLQEPLSERQVHTSAQRHRLQVRV